MSKRAGALGCSAFEEYLVLSRRTWHRPTPEALPRADRSGPRAAGQRCTRPVLRRPIKFLFFDGIRQKSWLDTTKHQPIESELIMAKKAFIPDADASFLTRHDPLKTAAAYHGGLGDEKIGLVSDGLAGVGHP